MSNILRIATAMAALSASSNSFPDYRSQKAPYIAQAEWTRKKCKSCRDCGSYCHGKISKHNDKACELYKSK